MATKKDDRLPWRIIEGAPEIKPTAPKPHKWANEIKAWADGKPVQYRHNGLMTSGWLDNPAEATPSWNNPNLEFRIKPAEPKVQWIMVTANCDGGVYPELTSSDLSWAWNAARGRYNFRSGGAIRIESVDGVITKLEYFTKDQVEEMLK